MDKPGSTVILILAFVLCLHPLQANSYQSLIGDFDSSGTVDFDDFFMFADGFGGNQSVFDLNGDGDVDFGDFFIIADNFGSGMTGSNSSSVVVIGTVARGGLGQVEVVGVLEIDDIAVVEVVGTIQNSGKSEVEVVGRIGEEVAGSVQVVGTIIAQEDSNDVSGTVEAGD